jgi:hypothetical protein
MLTGASMRWVPAAFSGRENGDFRRFTAGDDTDVAPGTGHQEPHSGDEGEHIRHVAVVTLASDEVEAAGWPRSRPFGATIPAPPIDTTWCEAHSPLVVPFPLGMPDARQRVTQHLEGPDASRFSRPPRSCEAREIGRSRVVLGFERRFSPESKWMSTNVILVIGPDQLISAVLAKEGTIVEARTLEVALLVAARVRPDVVVVAADVLGRPPSRFVSQLRAANPEVRLVTLATLEYDAARHGLVDFGPVVRLPVEAARLRAAVRRALQFALLASGIRRMRAAADPPLVDVEPLKRP